MNALHLVAGLALATLTGCAGTLDFDVDLDACIAHSGSQAHAQRWRDGHYDRYRHGGGYYHHRRTGREVMCMEMGSGYGGP